MQILIVEDDEYKRRKVADLVADVLPNALISEARSLHSGLRALTSSDHDLAILDMTMPTFDISAEEDGGRPQAYAGRELLRHMRRRNVQTPVVVLTQFDRFGEEAEFSTLADLDADLRMQHAGNYRGAIFYDTVYESWRSELAEFLRAFEQEMTPQ
jgi:DNA-binding NarL/FixJ family response regulator